MKAVWKFAISLYELNQMGEINVPMPRGAQLVHVGCEPSIPPHTLDWCNSIRLWALVDTEAEQEDRLFLVKGTGHPLDEDGASRVHVGSVVLQPFVWHMFERHAELKET